MSTLLELMSTQLKTAPANMVLSEAVCLMRDARIGALLIEKNGELVGIVSETDIVRKALAEKKNLEVTTLESIMTTPIQGIESYQSAHDAQDMMGDFGIRLRAQQGTTGNNGIPHNALISRKTDCFV